MKLFKIIMNCVITVLLVLSVVTNIFILSILGIHNGETFKQAILAKELLNGFSSVEPEDNNTVESTTPEDSQPTVKPDVDPIYQDEYVRITYMRYEDDYMGREYKFLIENLSDQPLTVVFDEVYIDGFKVDMSGLYCDDLAAGTKKIECFSLYQYEWEEFTDCPKKAEFRVRLINPNTFDTIHETSGKLNFTL